MNSGFPRLPPRDADTHKGTYGSALLVGGSRGMAGAIALAGMACLRSGAGLVRLAVPDAVLDVVAGFEPSYMTLPLASDAEGRIAVAALSSLLAQAERATCVALGPGLGQSSGLDQLVLALYQRCTRPMVVDADALNALARRRDALAHPVGARVLTPHPGEFARLLGRDQVPHEERESLASEFAACHGVVVVLKGHRTIVTDGHETATNATGNPGMATGGAGDVLTGVIAALICQGLSAWDAARLAAHVHGLAGDLAAAELGQVSLIASDLVRFLPAAFCQTPSA